LAMRSSMSDAVLRRWNDSTMATATMDM
jgi:hypothetical protein